MILTYFVLHCKIFHNSQELFHIDLQYFIPATGRYFIYIRTHWKIQPLMGKQGGFCGFERDSGTVPLSLLIDKVPYTMLK